MSDGGVFYYASLCPNHYMSHMHLRRMLPPLWQTSGGGVLRVADFRRTTVLFQMRAVSHEVAQVCDHVTTPYYVSHAALILIM
ncbi:Hypothetical predicted protein [Pelobates cultripes]|uniref:Uncharacterized protein n=1 Tax=Pelobates cultripes TaxID=61616 RepID=A0AAD1QWG2_PELCU|nr:Hypothetical predicted protein [Pelobates cultripes]CAH2218770.1 Hypothetical predicted protein [Pelobates cultripes]